MPIRTLGPAALIVLAASLPVHAQDAARFAERFEAVYGSMGSPLDLGAATTQDDGAILFENATATVEDMPPLTFSIRFDGVEETADGGFTAEGFEIAGFTADLGTLAPMQSLELSLEGITGENIVLPAEGETVDDTLRLARVIEAGTLSLRVGGAEIFSIESMRGAVTSGLDADPVDTIGFEYVVGPMRLDLVALDSEEAKSAAKRIGRLALEATFTMAGSWQLEDGLLSFEEVSIDAPGFGRLDMPFAILGFDRPLVADIYTAQGASLEASQRNDRAAHTRIQTGIGVKMLELRLVSAGLNFIDAGFVAAMTRIEAANNDIDVHKARDRMIEQARALIAGFNLGEFGDTLAERIASFLAEPDSLSIAIEPREPVRLISIGGAAIHLPGLVNLLSPTLR